MSDYSELVKEAGIVAGRHAFRVEQSGLANPQDLDTTAITKTLSDTFEIDMIVVENDILWCKEEEIERLNRVAKEAELEMAQTIKG